MQHLQNWSFNRDVNRLIVAFGLLSFAYMGVMSVLFNLYLLRLGIGIETIGVLIATGQIAWGLAALPCGVIGQHFGLRNTIVLGYLAVGLGIALILVVENVPPALRLPWIFGGWIVVWLGAALNSVNTTPFVMAAAAPHDRHRAFAAQSAVSAFMGVLGGVVGGVLPGLLAHWGGLTLDSPAPYRLTLWLCPLLYALAAWVMLGATSLRLPRFHDGPQTARAPYALLVLLGAVVMLQSTGEGAVRAFFNVYLDQGLARSPAEIGAIMGIAQALPIAAALLSPLLMQTLGTGRTLIFSSLITGAALLLMGLVAHWLIAALCFAVTTAMATVNTTARSLYSQEIVAERWRALSAAVATIGLALGWASMAGAGGFLAQTLGFSGLFVITAGLAFAGGGALLLDGVLIRYAAAPPQPNLHAPPQP